MISFSSCDIICIGSKPTAFFLNFVPYFSTFTEKEFPFRGPGFQRRSPSPTSIQPMNAEHDVNTPMEVPAVKRTKIPRQTSPGLVSQGNLDPEEEIER